MSITLSTDVIVGGGSTRTTLLGRTGTKLVPVVPNAPITKGIVDTKLSENHAAFTVTTKGFTFDWTSNSESDLYLKRGVPVINASITSLGNWRTLSINTETPITTITKSEPFSGCIVSNVFIPSVLAPPYAIAFGIKVLTPDTTDAQVIVHPSGGISIKSTTNSRFTTIGIPAFTVSYCSTQLLTPTALYEFEYPIQVYTRLCNVYILKASQSDSGVITTEEQVIAGPKTFLSPPTIPLTPSSDTSAVCKKYVDDQLLNTTSLTWTTVFDGVLLGAVNFTYTDNLAREGNSVTFKVSKSINGFVILTIQGFKTFATTSGNKFSPISPIPEGYRPTNIETCLCPVLAYPSPMTEEQGVAKIYPDGKIEFYRMFFANWAGTTPSSCTVGLGRIISGLANGSGVDIVLTYKL